MNWPVSKVSGVIISRTVPCPEQNVTGSRWAASTSAYRLSAQKSYVVVAVERRLVAQAPPDLVRLGVDVGVERVPVSSCGSVIVHSDASVLVAIASAIASRIRASSSECVTAGM